MNYQLRTINSESGIRNQELKKRISKFLFFKTMIHDSCFMIRSRLSITHYSLLVTFLLLLVTSYWLLITTFPAYAELDNPLNTKSIPDIIGRVIKISLGLAGSLSLLIFIWGGFLWITAHGDEKNVKKGWETLTWGSLGMVVIFGSYVIADYVLGLFGLK